MTRKVGDLLVIGLARPGTSEASNIEAFRNTVAGLLDEPNNRGFCFKEIHTCEGL